jgi:lysyl endopeptidase
MTRPATLRAPTLPLLLVVLAAGAHPALALAATDTIRIDLRPLIEQAAPNPNQFAVDVPHAVSIQRSGDWSTAGGIRTWQYAVAVPEAVSLSFHAPRIHLPPSATLTVTSPATTTQYRAADLVDGSLWSRIQPGDTLAFALQVRSDEAAQVQLEISDLQAGYRGLSPDVSSHETYRRMRAMAAGDPDTPCVENYACHRTAENLPAGLATVAITIANRYLCTGTMLNNTARDNTPYLLTARHCANGSFTPAPSDMAPTVVVYWNAMTPCGEPLGEVLYAPNPQRQGGASTVFEQKDTWVMRLDQGPIVDGVHLAGFDASGGEVDGGYAIHFAVLYNKQYTRWHGRAYRYVRPPDGLAPFPLEVLAVVNEFGVGGPGASGGALFTAQNRAAGVASIAPRPISFSGYGQCPLPNPPAPDEFNATGLYHALSSVWTLVEPGTRSGDVTLRSLLDPLDSGVTSMDSMPATRLAFTSGSSSPVYGTATTLQWSAENATGCTASGGVPGDGWSGSLAGSGSRDVNHSSAGAVTYQLRCSLDGGASVSGSVALQWTAPGAPPSAPPAGGGGGGDSGGGGSARLADLLLLAALLAWLRDGSHFRTRRVRIGTQS